MNDERDLETINRILTLAKLNINDLQPVSQTLYFADENLSENNYKLLQLDSHLLEEIKEGSTLCFKGEKDEEVVICSNTKTYQVVERETSNSLLLTTNLKFFNECESDRQTIEKVKVNIIFYQYLEATIGKPHLKKIEDMLSKSLYKGEEYEFEVVSNNLLTFEELCDKIQASSKEIKDALNLLPVIEIHNKIRLLDLEYHFRVLTYMIKLIDENSWKLDEVDYLQTVELLEGLVPKEVVSNLFDKYTEESKEVDGVVLYQYKEEQICKFFAQVLLYETGKFNLQEFLQAWRESVPVGMEPQEEMLYGIAVIDRKTTPNVIWAFNENTLPEDINERFKILFQTKEKWTVPEISPYIKRLATDKLDVNALLAKYARASKMDGVKYYSSKHGK